MEPEYDLDKQNQSFGDSRERLSAMSLYMPSKKSLKQVTIDDSSHNVIQEIEDIKDSDGTFNLEFQLVTNPGYIKNIPMSVMLKISGSLFQTVLTVLSCIIYVTSSYYDEEDTLFNILDLLIAFLFTIDYMCGFSNSKDKKKYMLKPLNVIDLIVILPIFVEIMGVIRI